MSYAVDYLKFVQIYKSPLGDCTNGGISSTRKHLILFNPSLSKEEVFSIIKEKNFDINDCVQTVLYKDYVKAVPISLLYSESPVWYMYGGNHLYSSDSRFKEVTGGCKQPIFLHDRVEKYEDQLSYD